MPEPPVMPEPADHELQNENTIPSLPRTSRRDGHPRLIVVAVWLIVVAMLVLLGFIYFAPRERPPLPSPPLPLNGPPRAGGAAPKRSAGVGGNAPNVVLPRLDDSDPMVRAVVGKLSTDPMLRQLPSANDLVRTFTVVVTNIADGISPAVHLRRFRSTLPFATIARDGVLYVDTRSYERYVPIARAFAPINVTASARAYATLRPLIEEAYRELGYSETPFDRTLGRAFVHLLRVPALADPVRIEPEGIGHAFIVGDVEALSPAQKQLLRSGPQNTQRIQEALRNLALAIGIPLQQSEL